MNNNETIINENKFTLTPEEMELSKNPESFKIYLGASQNCCHIIYSCGIISSTLVGFS